MVQVASFRRRLLADGVDLALLLGLATLLWRSGLTRPPLPPAQFDALDHLVTVLTEHAGLLRGPLALLVASGLLLALVSRGLGGRTPGEALLRVRVIDRAGRPPGPLRSLARALATLGGLLSLGLGYTWAVIDRQRCTLADRLCGTLLVRDRPPAPAAPPGAKHRPPRRQG